MVFYPSQEPNEIVLAGGDPDFDTPAHIRDAAIKSIIDGYTHYPPYGGIPEYKEAAVNYFSKWGMKYESDDVYATVGASQAIWIALASFLKPGDEILVHDPCWGLYYRAPLHLGAKIVPFPLNKGNYHLDPDELRKRVTKKSRMIVVCHPNNPTGTVFTKEELTAIAEVVEENDLIVVSDEIYNECIFDNRDFTAFPTVKNMKDRTVYIYSLSKTFSMTGWRLGCILATNELRNKITAYGNKIGCRAPTFIQMAGAAAFNGSMDFFKAWLNEYDVRRRFFVKRINEIEGAYYVYADITELGIKPAKFAEDLWKIERVKLANGEGFGAKMAKNHIRIALVQPLSKLEEATSRLEHYTKSLSK